MEPVWIILTADNSDIKNTWNDVVYVRATITDENGIPCPGADNEIKFSMEGAGAIAAVDNADVASHESFRGSEKKTFKGYITINAKTRGLQHGKIVLKVKEKK